jgi:hypothetical protein
MSTFAISFNRICEMAPHHTIAVATTIRNAMSLNINLQILIILKTC